MKIIDSITELSLCITNGYIEKMKNENPEKFDQLLNVFNNLVDLSIQLMHESPEFRTHFARIHSEFLKYPECEEVITAATKVVHGKSCLTKC